MRVAICYTVYVSDDYRRALRAYYGRDGLASREELKDHFQHYGSTLDVDLMTQAESEATRRG